MNILHVVPYFPPAVRYGGVPEAVFDLVRAQFSLGHTLTVLTTDAGLEQGTAPTPIHFEWKENSIIRAMGYLDGMRILYVRNQYPSLAQQFKIFTPQFVYPEVMKEVPHPLDVLHLHEINIPGYSSLVKKLRPETKVLCLSSHGSFHPPLHHGIKKILHDVLDPWLHRKWLPQVDRIFVLGESEKRQFDEEHIPEEKFVTLPLGQPVLEITNEDLPFEFQKLPGLFTILYLGRISAYKGILTLFESYQRLWQERFRTRLVFCGPDEGTSKAIERLSNRAGITVTRNRISPKAGVFFLPPIPRRLMSHLYARGDVTVCPSPYESFGLVPVESILCGTPAIATTAYGCLEHLNVPPSVLRVVPPEDPENLKEALKQIIRTNDRSMPELRDLLPSWTEVARRMVEVYS